MLVVSVVELVEVDGVMEVVDEVAAGVVEVVDELAAGAKLLLTK